LRLNTSGVAKEDAKVQHIARFLMEITLFHREFVGIQSSLIASGTLMLARFMCGKPRRPVARFENVAVRIALAIDTHFAEKLESVSEIVIRKYAPTYYGRASTICREWYLSGRRFVYDPETPATPVSAGIPTPGLGPSGSWPNKRGSWMSASPSGGSLSSSSSDAGDESPLTPITPVHSQVDPFSLASKENIAPGMFASVGAKEVGYNGKPNAAMVGLPNAFAHARPVLHALPSVGELALPNRTMRRLSH